MLVHAAVFELVVVDEDEKMVGLETYAEAEPPDRGAPVSPSPARIEAIENDRVAIADVFTLVILSADCRIILMSFWVRDVVEE